MVNSMICLSVSTLAASLGKLSSLDEISPEMYIQINK